MSELTSDHISYIIKDLNYRGIVLDGFQDEVIDHVVSAVEAEMKSGKRFADAYKEVLNSFGSTLGLQETQLHTLQSENQKTKIMLRNYLMIAWRNLRKHPFYSLINISGLAVGIAACLVMVLYVVDELSYDRYNTKASRIFRVNNEIKFGDNHFHLAASSAPVAGALFLDYPEIEATVRFCDIGTYLVNTRNGAESIKEENVIWTDSTFFKIFSVRVLQGDPGTALIEPNSIAISKRTADKYFPTGKSLGQSLILDNKYDAIVTAVYEDIPAASHFHFDIIISMYGDWPLAKQARSPLFDGNNFNTYVLLKEGADPEALEAKLPVFVEKYVKRGPSTPENKFEITLMPLLDIHLHSDLGGELAPNGSIVYVYLFTTIATLILAIACINFMNLSTARSSNRAKEVGVRKVMGSLRSHLVRQFLTESILITTFAFILALALAYFFLPFFNNLSLKKLSLPLGDPAFYMILACSVFVIGLIAGVYPSFFLSSFKPVNVLKGYVSLGMKSGHIRSALVVFQFVISIFLIVCTITVNRQLSYIQNKKLGFEKAQILIIKDAYALRPNIQSYKNQALNINSVESCSISGFVPIQAPGVSRNDRSFWKEGNQPDADNLVSLQNWRVDFDYIKTMGMNIIKGRGFSIEFPSDSSGVVLNEAAVLQFGLGDDPVGKKINTFSGFRSDGSLDFEHPLSWTVIGVAENFHFSSVKESIAPLGLFIGRSDGFIMVKFNALEAQETIQSLEKLWKGMAPGQPFQYSFLEEDFGKMYASEERLGQVFTLFATLAILIACLGLFALTAFTSEQRNKEIGIRKVLGASVNSIVILLSKDFGKLILIAFILALPLSWYSVRWWLESYSYKTEIGAPVYILAGAMAFGIALATMGYQSVKAATTNPVNSLRSE